MDVNHAALQALRERSGYSLRDLADESGISKSTIGAIENGTRTDVHPNTVKSLADALKVPIVALIHDPSQIAESA